MDRSLRYSSLLSIVLGAVLVGLVLMKTQSQSRAHLGSKIAAPRSAGCITPSAFRTSNSLPRFSGMGRSRSNLQVMAGVQGPKIVATTGAFAPPPVARTTGAFHNKFRFPLPMIFASFLTRLLTEQHFVRYNRRYSYNKVFALGVCSVFDQVFESLSEEKKTQLFEAFITALDEDPSLYRSDQASLEAWAKSKSAADILPKSDGDDVEQVLAEVAATSDSFLYSKFFSIGLFRLLELTGAKDPKALENLVLKEIIIDSI